MANKFTIQSIFEAVDRVTGPVRTMRASVEKYSKDTKKAWSDFTKGSKAVAAAMAGVTVAAAATYKAVSDFAERGDDIARNASILGLTAEAYQELSYAAKMADVEQEAFASASKKLSNNLGQLKMKTGSLYSTLAKTNPKLAVQLKNTKSNDEAFTLLADSIAKETNVQKRAALAQAAFGKTGQELIPMMEGLAEMRKKARMAGAVMSDEEVSAASTMDESLKSIKTSLMGVANTLLAKVSERLAPIVDRMTAWIAANKDMINQKIDDLFTGIGKAAEFVAWAWNSGVIPAVIALIAAFKSFQLVMAIVTAAQWLLNVAMTANPIGLIVVGIGVLIGLITLMVMNWNKIVAAIKTAGVAVGKFFQDWGGLFSLVIGPIGTMISLITTLATNWNGITAAFKEGGIIEGLKAIGATILQALIRPIRDFLKLISKIPGVKDFVKPAMDFVAGLDADLGASANKYTAPVSPQAAALESRSFSETRSTVDLNVAAAPGATVSARQKGFAPGVTLNLGQTAPRPAQ